jgi:hypothetical protein
MLLKRLLIATFAVLSACASPQKFDVPGDDPAAIPADHGIVIGRVQDRSTAADRKGCRTAVLIMMGVAVIQVHQVKVQQALSTYGVDSDGYYILHLPAGKVTPGTALVMVTSSSSTARGPGGSDVFKFDLSTETNPLTIEKGRVTVIPTVHYQGSGLDYIDIGRGKDGQIVDHFKELFPQVFQAFPMTEPAQFKAPPPAKT